MHEGHRKRLRSRLAFGEAALSDSEVLEILLFYACPRRDVGMLARRLVEKFGSLAGVMSASIEEIKTVEGAGQNIAEYIVCTGKCLKLLMQDDREYFEGIYNISDFRDFMLGRFKIYDTPSAEMNIVVRDGRIMRAIEITERETPLHIAARSLSSVKAKGVYLSIYRPHDTCQPKEGDDELVESVILACDNMGLRFHDCGICGDDGFFSYILSERIEKFANKYHYTIFGSTAENYD